MNNSTLAQPQTQLEQQKSHNTEPTLHDPSIVIDLRWNRIRIHKQTLHLLGDPDYVQLLVNPEKHTLLIQRSSSSDPLAHRIRYKEIHGHRCFELHSKYLIDTMSDVFLYLSPNQVYRITGKLYKSNNLAHFNLRDSKCINSMEGEKADEPKSEVQ